MSPDRCLCENFKFGWKRTCWRCCTHTTCSCRVRLRLDGIERYNLDNELKTPSAIIGRSPVFHNLILPLPARSSYRYRPKQHCSKVCSGNNVKNGFYGLVIPPPVGGRSVAIDVLSVSVLFCLSVRSHLKTAHVYISPNCLSTYMSFVCAVIGRLMMSEKNIEVRLHK